jgi:hypothetical protein
VGHETEKKDDNVWRNEGESEGGEAAKGKYEEKMRSGRDKGYENEEREKEK